MKYVEKRLVKTNLRSEMTKRGTNIMKVVFHVDKMKKWALALANIENMAVYYSSQQIAFQLEVVANSAAVRGYIANGLDTEETFEQMEELT